MAGRGGYQPPASPAPVSGPGQLSQRTDGTVEDQQRRLSVPTGTDGQWGDRAALDAIQAGADLAGTPDVPRPGGMGGGGGPAGATPLNAPTERPDEAVTAFTPPSEPAMPADVAAAAIRRAYAQNPTPYLRTLVYRLLAEGR